MYTVKSAIKHLTDHKTIMENVRETLRQIDPQYIIEERHFHMGVKTLRNALEQREQDSLDLLLELEERRMTANFLFLIWRGINQNLICFQDQTEKDFLNQDYESIHEADVMENMPANERCWEFCHSFHQVVPQEQDELIMPITSYYCYLETVAYKLAHYYGFHLADYLLYYLIPEYRPDFALTRSYRSALELYLKADMLSLDG